MSNFAHLFRLIMQVFLCVVAFDLLTSSAQLGGHPSKGSDVKRRWLGPIRPLCEHPQPFFKKPKHNSTLIAGGGRSPAIEYIK